jgi:hypothetical protein
MRSRLTIATQPGCITHVPRPLLRTSGQAIARAHLYDENDSPRRKPDFVHKPAITVAKSGRAMPLTLIEVKAMPVISEAEALAIVKAMRDDTPDTCPWLADPRANLMRRAKV